MPKMNWYYTFAGGHVHVRVFMSGGKCGDLVFRDNEFAAVRKQLDGLVNFFVEER